MARLIAISGCSGGGKSTLLAALKARGHDVVEEPGRRIVREEMSGSGAALPWRDPIAFARRAVAMSLADLQQASGLVGPVFFDRGLIDAAAALTHLGHAAELEGVGLADCYDRQVFMAPPWREIFVSDEERPHGFQQAVEEYERLIQFYPEHGYQIRSLPKVSIQRRVDFVLRTF